MKRKSINGKVIFYTLFFITTIILGLVGFYKYYKNTAAEISLLGTIYDVLRLFFMEHDFSEEAIPLCLSIARLLAPLFLATAIINLFFSFIQQRFNLFIIKKYEDHMIYCGLGLKAQLLIIKDLNDGKDVVVIEKNEQNQYLADISPENFRFRKFDESVRTTISLSKENHARIIIGDACEEQILRKAGVARANKIIINAGNDIVNLDILSALQKIYDTEVPKNEHNVIVDLTEHYNERFFKQFEDKKNDSLNIHSFNMYRRFAAKIVDDYSPDKFTLIKSKNDSHASILIYGMNTLGENLILEAAQIYNFANLKKTNIYVVDSDIENKKERFLTVFPNINKAVQLNFYEEKGFINLIQENHLLHNISVCFICSENDSQNFIFAQRVRQLFVSANCKINKLEDEEIFALPKVVLLSLNYNQIVNSFDNFRGKGSKLEKLNISYHNIFEELTDILDENYDDIGKVIHQKYSNLKSSEIDKEWEGLTDEQKDFNRWAARHLKVKLRYFNLDLDKTDPSSKLSSVEFSFNADNRDMLAEWEHFRWCAEKHLTDFVSGEYTANDILNNTLKDDLKWHKSLRPWNDLNKSDKDKDYELTKLNEILDELMNNAELKKKYVLVKINP